MVCNTMYVGHTVWYISFVRHQYGLLKCHVSGAYTVCIEFNYNELNSCQFPIRLANSLQIQCDVVEHITTGREQ